MGNELKIPQIFNDINNQYLIKTEHEMKHKVKDINRSFKINQKPLHLQLILDQKTIKYDKKNWKKSTVKGWLQNIPKQYFTIQLEENNNNKKLSQDKEQYHNKQTNKIYNNKEEKMGYHQHKLNQAQQSITNNKLKQKQSKIHNITLSFEEINTLHEQITSLSAICHHDDETPTPSPQQEQQCCICLENKTSMVLPCSHAFCDKCTVKYIIEAQQKKCPQCRQEIKGSRETVGRQIFTVVQDEEVTLALSKVYEQVRHDVLHLLGKSNPKTVEQIRKQPRQN